jgi:signal transduction histidine kinase
MRLPILAGAAILAIVAAAGADEMAPRYDETLELIGLVEDASALVSSDGVEKACEQFRESGSRWFQGEAYVFVLSMEGQTICHPARPGLEGQYLNEMRDPKGKPILDLMVRELEESDDGWVHYQWPRPGERIFRWKTTYLQKAVAPDGQEVMVSSGRYQMKMEPFFVVEQVEDAIASIRERGEDEAFSSFRDPASGFLFYSAYVFVLDEEGILLVNNGFPENEGKQLLGLRDIDQRPFVQEMMEVPTGGSAWIHYKWPKPGDNRPSAKSSFVRRVDFDGRELVVGSGVYFEQEPEVRDLGPKPDVD